MFALPHLLVTKFPLLALKIPTRHSIDSESFLMAFSSLGRNPFLVLSAVAFMVIFIVRTAKNSQWCGSMETGWNFEFLSAPFHKYGTVY